MVSRSWLTGRGELIPVTWPKTSHLIQIFNHDHGRMSNMCNFSETKNTTERGGGGGESQWYMMIIVMTRTELTEQLMTTSNAHVLTDWLVNCFIFSNPIHNTILQLYMICYEIRFRCDTNLYIKELVHIIVGISQLISCCWVDDFPQCHLASIGDNSISNLPLCKLL